MARALGRQDGCLASRVIGDGRSKPYAAQAIFEDAPGDWFPDGTRRVIVPSSFRLACLI